MSAIENQTTGLIGIEPERDYAIYELRTRAADLPAVCSLLRPEIGIVTHCEARAEVTGELTCAAPGLEMLEALSSDGWAVLTGDDPQLRRLATGRVRNTVWVGRSLHCDLVATHIEATSGHLRFRVNGLPICVPVWGRHYLHSVLAALAVGRILGLTLAEAAEGLADFQGPPQRCQVQEYQGAKLIDDTYSSHPTAVRAALELLRDFDATGRRIIVCGDLPDLDAAGELAHRELGDQVVTLCGADLLVTCGEHSREIAEGAARAGMPPSRITACTDPEQAVPRLDSLVKPGDVVLVKGARGRAMDRVLNLLAPVSERRAA